MAVRSAVVVGAGIVGSATAWGLHGRGWDVTLLEAGPLPNPRASSGGVHRLIRATYGTMRGYTAMIPPAYALWERLLHELGRPDLMTHTGMLAVDTPSETFAADSAATLDALGMPYEALDDHEVRDRFPQFRVPDGATALYTAQGHFLRAGAIVGSLTGHLAERGVTVRARSEVVDVDADAGRVTLADGTALSADAVVVAAGPWTPALLGGRSPTVTPSRQVVVDLEPPPHLRAAWARGPAFLLPPAYGIPPRDELPLKVGDHAFSRTGDPRDDRVPRDDEVEAVLEVAREALADFDAHRVLGARACFYTVRDDERFVVRPLGARGAVCTGFSGHGFKFGPIVGHGVAAAIDGASPWADVTAWAAGERDEVPFPLL